MKKFISKAIICASVAALLLTGCGTGTNTESTASSSAGNSSVQAQTSDLTFPLKEKATLTAFVMTPYSGENGDYTNNYVTNYLEEKQNIKIDFKYSVTGDDGKTKLNLLMASGETLPDIFLSTKWSKAETMLYGKQGLIVPLNNYLKDAPNWNELNKVSPLRLGDITMPDGNIYCYGDDNECFHCMFQSRMWIYKPWVDKLAGGKIPTTTDELYTFLKAVKEKDPNGNGKADEIPFTGNIAAGGWATDPTTFITNAFVQNNNILSNTNPVVGAGFVVNNGKVEYQFTKDEYKDSLIYLNKLYKEGLLDSQTFTQNADQQKATVQGTPQLAAMAPGGWWPCNTDALLKEQEGSYQDWVVLEPIKGPKGVQLAAYYPTNYFQSNYGLVSADCKNPELAVKFFDLLASQEMTLITQNGPKGIAWDYVSEGTSIAGGEAKWKKIPAKKLRSSQIPDYTDEGLNFVKYVWDPDAVMTHNTNEFRLSQYCAKPETSVEALLYQCGKAYSKYKPDDNTMLPNLAYSEEDAKKIADYTVSIGKFVNQATVQFITGDMDIKTWQNYVDKINSMDLKGYLAIQQNAYDQYAKSLNK